MDIPTIEIQMSSRIYSESDGDTPAVILANKSNADIYYPFGSYVGVQRLVKGSWQGWSPWIAIDGRGRSMHLPAGEQLNIDQIPFSAFAQVPGTYRLRFHLFRDSALQEPLEQELCDSEPFDVVK